MKNLVKKNLFGILVLCGLVAGAQAQVVWTRQNSGDPNTLHNVIWTGSKLIIGGRYTFTILTSPEGKNWTYRETDNTGGAGSGYTALLWTGSQAIALSWADSRILTSPDGVSWTTRFKNEQDTVGLFPTAIASSGSLIVVFCQGGKLLTSPDGVVWTQRKTDFEAEFNGLAWTGTQFAAAGRDGAIATSFDGITWTVRNSGTTHILNDMLWTGTQFVAVGEGGTLLTSTNGILWTPRISGTTDDLNGVTWTGNQLVVVGSDPTLAKNNVILSSPDGIVWTGRSLGIPDLLEGVTWMGSQFVMVGQFGGVWTSPENLTPVTPNPEFARPLGMQWAGTQLVVTIPEFLKNGNVVATIYGVTGEKKAEARSPAVEKTLAVSTTALPAGAYFLEIRGANGWRTWPFQVAR